MFFNNKKYKSLHHIINAKNLPVECKYSWYSIVTSWFYIGFLPIAPGTLGSLAAYPLYRLIISIIQDWDHPLPGLSFLSLFLAFILFLIGWYATILFHKETALFDHRSIVIDEVVGQLLIIGISAKPLFDIAKQLSELVNWQIYNVAFFIAFIIFRIFDIIKPFGIKYIDRYYKGAFAVMLDDILAAIMGSALIIGCARLLEIFS